MTCHFIIRFLAFNHFNCVVFLSFFSPESAQDLGKLLLWNNLPTSGGIAHRTLETLENLKMYFEILCRWTEILGHFSYWRFPRQVALKSLQQTTSLLSVPREEAGLYQLLLPDSCRLTRWFTEFVVLHEHRGIYEEIQYLDHTLQEFTNLIFLSCILIQDPSLFYPKRLRDS